ncbi:hypothetical protein E4T54_11920 (plasmid) [Legionella geestiana]|nr:hypothetical protein E4T54_11920 [Legionella geestiana]
MLMNAVIASTIALTGCSTTDMKAMVSNGDSVSTTKEHRKPVNQEQVKIYHSKADIPRHYKIIGRVTAQNHNFVGMTFSQESITSELKKQAALIGAQGITNITSGLSQTTAEAIVLK